MKIKDLTLKKLSIPFKVKFKHASAERMQTEAVICVAESEKGKKGYGEGCPRSYVTGETLDTAFEFFAAHRESFLQLETLELLKSWALNNVSVLDKNPAAWCAVELALIDLLAKGSGQSVEALLSLAELNGKFIYTAVLGVEGLSGFKKQLETYTRMGFSDFKIKVSGNLEEDQAKCDTLRSLDLKNLRVRWDANNLWSDSTAAIQYIGLLPIQTFAVEEPLQPENYKGCQTMSEALGVPVILDESFQRCEQFQRIREMPGRWIINLRISKMGGILRSLEVAEQARQLKIPLIIGAQVGESSLLTRAALTIVNACRENILAQEGAFGTYLLEYDLVTSSIMFGPGGVLKVAEGDSNPGFGLDIDEGILDKAVL